MPTLTAAHLTALTAATTPEEAYKIFAGAATQLIGQAVADAMGKVLGAASATTASVPAIAGWEDFFKGAKIDLVWGTPGYRTPPTLLNHFASGTPSDPALPARMAGIGFSIGITGSF